MEEERKEVSVKGGFIDSLKRLLKRLARIEFLAKEREP